MGKRVQRIPSWPGVKRFTPTKAVYICADQLVTSSHFACGEAADHTFRLSRNPSRIDAKRGDHFLQADLLIRPTPSNVLCGEFDCRVALHCQRAAARTNCQLEPTRYRCMLGCAIASSWIRFTRYHYQTNRRLRRG